MRKSVNELNTSFKRQITKTFAQIVADIDKIDQAHLFLEDFFSDTEYEIFAKRLAIAYWLKKGRSYRNIKQNLKVSSATIAQVKSTMNNSGFQLALKIIEAEEWSNKWEKRIKKFIK